MTSESDVSVKQVQVMRNIWGSATHQVFHFLTSPSLSLTTDGLRNYLCHETIVESIRRRWTCYRAGGVTVTFRFLFTTVISIILISEK